MSFFVCFAVVLAGLAAGAAAQSGLAGARGLNTVPDARMAEAGTARFFAAAIDPYLHAGAGFQVAEPLYLGVRQSAEISSLRDPARRLYPGVDVALRLRKESAHGPAVVLGMQAALGHRRMAGEYLALSKRYEAFDFTAGAGWGRMGSAGDMRNPLRHLFRRFGKERALDGDSPGGPADWFTGERIGFFGGASWDLPWADGVSAAIDWNADRYSAEKTIPGFSAPAPWAAGLHYAPFPWVSAGVALAGGRKLMLRVSLQPDVRLWPGRRHKETDPPHFRAERTGAAVPAAIPAAAARDGIGLYDAAAEGAAVSSFLSLDLNRSTPLQVGRAARPMANLAGKEAEEVRVTPLAAGLSGVSVSLSRRDMEQAVARHQGSPQEIWRNVRFQEEAPDLLRKGPLVSGPDRFRFILDNRVSFSEEDSGLLYRTGVIAAGERQLSAHVVAGSSLRLDLRNNLHHFRDYRARAVLPVRSDEDDFAARGVAVERSYVGWMTTILPGLHAGASAGMLEEMYGGAGGEILYRPFGKTFAVGAEAYEVFKRDPFSFANLGFSGDHLLTGHLQAWYEFPGTDLTLQIRAGRYLAADLGGSVALRRDFRSGAQVEAFVTATDAADYDPFGNITHVYSGVRIRLPFGNVPYVPEGSEIRFSAAPLGRDAGQALDPPFRLYDVSEALSLRHIAQYWGEVTE